MQLTVLALPVLQDLLVLRAQPDLPELRVLQALPAQPDLRDPIMYLNIPYWVQLMPLYRQVLLLAPLC
jgi:hypothetical protein